MEDDDHFPSSFEHAEGRFDPGVAMSGVTSPSLPVGESDLL
jgi:hypothetical protein